MQRKRKLAEPYQDIYSFSGQECPLSFRARFGSRILPSIRRSEDIVYFQTQQQSAKPKDGELTPSSESKSRFTRSGERRTGIIIGVLAATLFFYCVGNRYSFHVVDGTACRMDKWTGQTWLGLLERTDEYRWTEIKEPKTGKELQAEAEFQERAKSGRGNPFEAFVSSPKQ